MKLITQICALFTIRQGIDEAGRPVLEGHWRERAGVRGSSVRQLNAKMLLNIISDQQWATIMWAPSPASASRPNRAVRAVSLLSPVSGLGQRFARLQWLLVGRPLTVIIPMLLPVTTVTTAATAVAFNPFKRAKTQLSIKTISTSISLTLSLCVPLLSVCFLFGLTSAAAVAAAAGAPYQNGFCPLSVPFPVPRPPCSVCPATVFQVVCCTYGLFVWPVL